MSNTIVNMELKTYLAKVEQFLKDYLETSHQDCYVLGLSGGVDSSLVAALAKNAVGKDKLMCIMMPIDSHPSDLEDAIKVAKALDLRYIVMDGSKSFHETVDEFARQGVTLDKMSLSNLKVRIRMYNHCHPELGLSNQRFAWYQSDQVSEMSFQLHR